ncbi:hypothetical protein FRC00_011465, partial [Tulasnella sp. 408]
MTNDRRELTMYTSQICIGSTLDGVKGDFPFVLKELTARANSSIQVITDLQLAQLDPKVQILSPNAQNVIVRADGTVLQQKASIEKVGQAMKPGGLCYVYLAGHAEQDSYETAFMPLPSGEHLDGKDLVAQLQAAGRNGGTFV